MKTSLGELAHHLGCELHGDPSPLMEGVAEPCDAGSQHVAAILTKDRTTALERSHAGALLVAAVLDDPRPQLISNDPRTALARLVRHFCPEEEFERGIHTSAVVAASAEISAAASVGAFCLIEGGAIIEEGARLDPYVYVGRDVRVGAQAWVGVRATLCAGVKVGEGAKVGPGAVIGAQGFGLWREDGRWRRIRSVGGVELGEGAEVGANSCVDAGTLSPTRVGAGVQLDNLVQIGHNAQLGDDVIVCAQSGVAGSASVGRGCELGGQVGIKDHVVLGEGARIGAKSGVIGDVPSGATYSGYPAIPHGQWLRSHATFRRLGRVWRALRRLDG
ncbi:MAG: UDP-3-O-(3-hydroxymyristoyl)glucosamine N-acyltransferase [Deltaproteobacteria bacterium]|nr:UDP-3-O-(3-hydroxymyristoyl)glucosamine N-acyltransferase [Deltaproteobacteria bacterium]